MNILHRLVSSPGRIAFALLLALMGLVVSGLAIVATWVDPGRLLQIAASLGLASPAMPGGTLAVVGLVLASLGMLVVLVPAPGRGAIARISVHIDAENQPYSQTQAKAFLAVLDQYLHGRRADRFYYTDASNGTNMTTFRTIWSRGGFLLVDISRKPTIKHKQRPLPSIHVMDALDVELALHAYERALLGPRHQEVILIAADRDYFALIRRLKLQGHRVQVWARAPGDSVRKMCEAMGVRIHDLGPELTAASGATGNKLLARKSHPGTAQLPSSGPSTDRATGMEKDADTSNSVTGLSLLLQAMSVTVQTIQASQQADAAATSKERLSLFKMRLGGAQNNILGRLGYDGRYGDRLDYWLTHLAELGLLTRNVGRLVDVPSIQTLDASQASERMYAFLREVATVATQTAKASGNGSVVLRALCDAMAQWLVENPAHRESRLLGLLRDNSRRVAHMRYFCCCARALGLLHFVESTPLGHVLNDIG